jgi:hypothetical protein
VINLPNHKQAWCLGFPIHMRLLGWPEDCCRAASEYIEAVRKVYTGRAWYTYTVACDRFLAAPHARIAQNLVAYFPRRMNVSRHLNIMA